MPNCPNKCIIKTVLDIPTSYSDMNNQTEIADHFNINIYEKYIFKIISLANLGKRNEYTD